MPELWQKVDGKIRFFPHEGQQKMLKSRARVVAVIAGTQSGKTSSGPLWLWQEIRRRGEGDYLAISASYDLLKLKMLPEMQKLFCELLDEYIWVAGDALFKSKKDRTRIILRSAVAERGLESSTAIGAWMDEAGMDGINIGIWEALQRRLSIAEGRALITTTPYNLGWLKTAIYDKWVRGSKDIEVINFSSTMNPNFPVSEYERMKAEMPEWRFKMFYDGQFTQPAGLIYQSFDSEKHVIRPIDIPAEWERTVGVDFGYNNTVTVWCAKDPSRDVWYMYDEVLSRGKSTPEHVSKMAKFGEGLNAIYIGGAPAEEQHRRDWTDLGLPVEKPWIADVEAGINRVESLLKQDRLYVFDHCIETIEQFGSYSRRLNEADIPTKTIKNKDEYHYLDALRYAASTFNFTPDPVIQPVAPPEPSMRSKKAIKAMLKEMYPEQEPVY